MHYDDLVQFIEGGMRMSHVYQPVMLRTLLHQEGHASRYEIARALLNEDRSQLEYYAEITRDMVGRVLANRGIVRRDGSDYALIGFDKLTAQQVQQLRDMCDRKLDEYVTRRGDAIWEHRRGSSGYVSGTLKVRGPESAKFRCELCGVPADERALEVDHIVPRNKGGTDEIANLQALCCSCNATKRDRDDTDFRALRLAYQQRSPNCPFCTNGDREVLLQNSLALALRDLYPVTDGHVLIVPRRHISDYLDLGTAEVRACQLLLFSAQAQLRAQDASIQGFSVGINSGEVAGQTVMHSHLHLIPRRNGDCPNPRGGVRAVIPGRAEY